MNGFSIRKVGTSDQYFKTHRGKQLWATAAAAKNGWNAAQPYRARVKFSDQDEWEVVPMTLITLARYHGLLESEWMLQELRK